MADEKLNTGPAENTSPEAAGPITTPEQAAASEPDDVVVSFDKINELMAEKRQNACAEVEKAAPDKPKPSKRDKVSRSDGKAPDAKEPIILSGKKECPCSVSGSMCPKEKAPCAE